MRIAQDEQGLESCDKRWRDYIIRQHDDPDILKAHDFRRRSRDVEQINQGILEKRRVVVSLGCSFTHGQSAFPEEMVEKLRPRGGGNVSNFDYVGKGHDIDDMLELATEYKLPLQVINDTIWNNTTSNLSIYTKALETDNSFVNKFCELTDNNYVPINLGNNGNGNIASINRLFMYPIDWHLCEEILVLWCHSDQDRYDFYNDDSLSFDTIGGDHSCMWPKYEKYNPNQEKYHAGSMWHDTQWLVTQTIRSPSFSYLNFIDQGIKLDTWCRANNANLMIFGAFSNISRSEVENHLLNNIVIRDHNRLEIENVEKFAPSTNHVLHTNRYLDKFPWHKKVYPRGYDTFLQLALSKEEDPDLMNKSMWNLIDQGGSQNDWIFPCGHPSGKSHQLLAKDLFNIALDQGII